MEIKILGTGCPKCKRLEELAREAATELGIEAKFTKVNTMDGIMAYDVTTTPGLVIDEVVRSSGRLPRKDEIKGWMAGSIAEEVKMLQIKVFGPTPPCANCKRAEEQARKAAAEFAGQVEVVKLDALGSEAEAFGIMSTPLVVVGDEVVGRGRVVPATALAEIIKRKLGE